MNRDISLTNEKHFSRDESMKFIKFIVGRVLWTPVDVTVTGVSGACRMRIALHRTQMCLANTYIQ